MKIAVCGCSFSMPVGDEYAGTHWSEVLAKKLNAELIVFARQGISNNVIRLQINEAIKQKPDWVFINSTTPGRIEFATDKNNVSNFELGYDYKLGLKNFNYLADIKTKMISETIFSIVDWDEHPFRKYNIDSNTKQAVESYAAFVYDHNWKMQVDNWVINSGLWNLHDLGIKFIYNQTILNENYIIHDLPEWFVKKYLVTKDLDLLKLMRDEIKDGTIDPGYHTTIETQAWMADRYLKIMQERQQLYYNKDSDEK